MNPTVNPSEFVPREPWPAEGPSRAPYWTFVDPATYEREQQRIFRGSAWHFLGLEAEVPEPGSRRLRIGGPRADLDLESAQRYWRTNHAAVATHMHGIARYVQNHARPGGAEYPTMGMPFVWFDSAEALRANATSPELAATRADEPNFLGPDLPFVLVREEHII